MVNINISCENKIGGNFNFISFLSLIYAHRFSTPVLNNHIFFAYISISSVIKDE